MISFIKEDVDNGKNASCKMCVWNEEGDSSIGLNSGCTHPILYNENGNIIDEANDLIIECIFNPRQCCLMEKSK
jgi:hypothetical protein